MIDNYKSLPLGDYQDILALCKDKSLEELDRQVKILSILTKMDEDTLLNPVSYTHLTLPTRS